jgi:glycolate oxidase FAD binding subunit
LVDRDFSEALVESVVQARADGICVSITGTGSKDFLVRADSGAASSRLLSLVEHAGVVAYRPDELVVTARAGTPLRDLVAVLARENQMLPFEPPLFLGTGTLGGAIASGLAGPGRPWRGSVRDAVLGVVMINGLGQKLTFGGQVMKNVAGYDVSRLQVGAFGTLGVLLEISIKVIPQPTCEYTQRLELSAQDALTKMRQWARQPLPITASCYYDGILCVRLSGAESSVLTGAGIIGGESSVDSFFWTKLNDQELPFFKQRGVLLRQMVPPASKLDANDCILEWSGGKRWFYRSANDCDALAAQRFGAGFARASISAPGGDRVRGDLQRRIKHAFDPDNVLNPELLHADQAT